MEGFGQLILRTDTAGMPLDWIDFREAVKLHCLELIAYSCGDSVYRIHGGINASSQQRSIIEVNSIIATYGNSHAVYKMRHDYVPPLNNPALFRRDDHICMYCGGSFSKGKLSRDHVTPISQNGDDGWNNVVTACIRCNNHKAGRTPEQAGMQLLAIPFKPTHAEYIYLQGRNILSDQMAFLRAHFPRTSPLHDRLDRRHLLQ